MSTLPAIRSQMSTTVTRREAEHMLTRAQEQLQVQFQFGGAGREIERAQQGTDALDKEQQGQSMPCKVTSKGASIGDKGLGH